MAKTDNMVSNRFWVSNKKSCPEYCDESKIDVLFPIWMTKNFNGDLTENGWSDVDEV